LSARITSRTYFSVTMIVTDQKISEMIPKTLSLGHESLRRPRCPAGRSAGGLILGWVLRN
jgi:hypothetical protein